MATNIQSNPVYYSLSTLSSGQNRSSRTVVLRKRSDHNGFGVYLGEDVPSGVYVVTVERNSPAAHANIQPGDRVLAVNGQLVSKMSGNPKDAVVKAATNSESLTLTIQSTDILDSLNIPLTNSYSGNNTPLREQHVPEQIPNTSANLESYILSLFGNENIQILSASTSNNNHEFIIKSDSQGKSSMDSSSIRARQAYTSDQERDSQRDERRRRRRQRKQMALVTQGTQTATYNNENNNTLKEPLQTSPPRAQSSQPSMGTRVPLLRAQPSNNSTNDPYDGKAAPLSRSTATQPSPVSDDQDDDIIVQSPPALKIQHMVDTVGPAIALHNQQQPNKSEPATVRGPPPVTTQTTAPTSSRGPPATTQTTASTSSRGPPVPVQTTAPTSSSRDPPGKGGRDAAPATREVPAPTRDQNPPPYTTLASISNPENTSQNTYNVPQAEQNRVLPVRNPDTIDISSPVPEETLHEVHLQRSPDFQGFGFHLQYNKRYYLVQRIEEHSPAETAGLRANDVIHKINQQTTDKMPHKEFVQIVNDSTNVVFLIQPFDQYIRSNPVPARNPELAATVSNAINDENDKRKSGLSKALGKIKQ